MDLAGWHVGLVTELGKRAVWGDKFGPGHTELEDPVNGPVEMLKKQEII